MFENFKSAVGPHIFGLILMCSGWFMSIFAVKLTDIWNPLQAGQNSMFNPFTIVGLILIIIGAYLPDVIRRKKG